ncbi:MAG: nuclear transport factor 2 family protein [Actinobacteria bacterium]|nr:nuclear transport factor 2 family protein [Actinomycetota bacterium]
MTSAVVHELIGLSNDLIRAVSERDVSRLDEILAPEFTLQGAAGYLDRVQLLEAAGGPYEIDEWQYEEIEPEVYGNTAVIVSRYRQEGRFLGKDLSHPMHVTDIWVRKDAHWRTFRRPLTIIRRHASRAD